MKKLLILLAVVSVSMTGCLKSKGYDDPFKDVRQGLVIHTWTSIQNNIALQPANAAIRLAILMAEAEKQGVEDLNMVKDGASILCFKLLGYSSTITDKGDGLYEIKYVSSGVMDDVVTRVGTYYINTRGKSLAQTDRESWWSISADPDFTYQLYIDGTMRRVNMTNGETTIFNNGDGTYAVQPLNIQTAFSDTKDNVSNWSGMFRLVSPSEGLAYSDCKGKVFGWSGYAAGPSFLKMAGPGFASTIGMSYKVTDGKYLSGSFSEGIEVCEFTSNYDMTFFPASDVTVEVVLGSDGNRRLSVTYNGVTRTQP